MGKKKKTKKKGTYRGSLGDRSGSLKDRSKSLKGPFKNPSGNSNDPSGPGGWPLRLIIPKDVIVSPQSFKDFGESCMDSVSLARPTVGNCGVPVDPSWS